ncbi:hypothetical protein [Lelliottia sp. WAP21]|uniref:hypothetical protein n=1 Tax=Lelliottia sp. WAP21 TaxID=2877426 RepID=UPI001E459B57|nr:hypothetical protein [Lelliottia sp. WAP21]
MTELVIAIPRFSLSGGNLVSLNMGLYLQEKGFDVYANSGFSKKPIGQVKLKRHRRGILNSLLNLLSFINLSFYSLFCKFYISSHHLTALFNFIKPARFALVQDIESQFYPQKLYFLGVLLWKNYLRADKVIVTNKYLAEKIGLSFSSANGFAYIDFESPLLSCTNELTNEPSDALLVLRDGEYKGCDETIALFESLNDAGIKTILINQSRKIVNSKHAMFIRDGLPRHEFLQYVSSTRYFICLSKWEGLGLPNLEAFCLGAKVISTPIPSSLILKEYFPDGVSLNTDVSDVIDLIHQDRLRNESENCDFFNKQNKMWMDYVLKLISSELKHAS